MTTVYIYEGFWINELVHIIRFGMEINANFVLTKL